MHSLSVKSPLCFPSDTTTPDKVTDESVQIKRKSLQTESSNNLNRVLLEIQDNQQAKFTCMETRSNEQLRKYSLLEMNSNTSTTDSETSQNSRDSSHSMCALDDLTIDFLETEDYDEIERELFIRCIVLGGKNTAKHALVKSNFDTNPNQNPVEEQNFGLIMKTSVHLNTTKKYHFWIQTVKQDQSDVTTALWQTYYKWATAFIFVYDIASKESFEILEEAIKQVLQVVPQESFFGILVGMDSNHKNDRVVDYEDAIQLKMKYGFSHLFETNCAIEGDNHQLLRRLSKKLKVIFEAI